MILAYPSNNSLPASLEPFAFLRDEDLPVRISYTELRPPRALGFAFIFGFAEALAFQIMVLSGIKEIVPYQFILMIPYITTLVAVAIVGRAMSPQSHRQVIR
ncbi:hypothetical protein AKJ47_03300 [candidate division MSBL1 archaeon SCGC-AAA261G05]|uniref:Uncharacterized protein n=2 Tax=candidate division MSBL1 TaxID=215777 RepID=A0A133V862_9EURY|nr:hypothetical protein AKJ47_03300 [candidate division MSBL1 archaeon SCGC-AAA261G05]KXB04732.1 hypothetical protein AKJ48_01555 [candidate division MSBL1 archaeon SCGC-AAA261O19]